MCIRDRKIGLRLINVNITDINDESGYIEALGREAASKAINDAKVSVANNDKLGAIGAASAERDQRISVSLANSEAVSGENEAKVKIAESEALRREREAELLQRAVTAEKIAEAKAKEESFAAQRLAELARAQLEQAKLEADVIIAAEIEKKQKLLEAEAEAEQIRARAKGEADSILLRKQAEAEGLRAMLSKQAEGFRELVEAVGEMCIRDSVHSMRAIVTSFEIPFTQRNDEGGFDFVFYNEHTVDVFNKLYDFVNNNDSSFILDPNLDHAGGQWLSKIFVEDRALFMTYTLDMTDMLRDMKSDFGILPMPKYNETQKNYMSHSYDGASIFAVPVSASDYEFSGAMLDAMSAESKYTVIPAFYDLKLMTKVTRDDDSAEMLDIIRQDMTYDFAYVHTM